MVRIMIDGEEQTEYTIENIHEMVEYASKEQYQKYMDEKLVKTYTNLRLERLKTEIEMILVIKDSFTHLGHTNNTDVKKELHERLVDIKTSAFSDIQDFKTKTKDKKVQVGIQTDLTGLQNQTNRLEPAIGLL